MHELGIESGGNFRPSIAVEGGFDAHTESVCFVDSAWACFLIEMCMLF